MSRINRAACASFTFLILSAGYLKRFFLYLITILRKPIFYFPPTHPGWIYFHISKLRHLHLHAAGTYTVKKGYRLQWWANLDQAPKDLDKTIFRDLSPTPLP
jgi:hypothetical protein